MKKAQQFKPHRTKAQSVFNPSLRIDRMYDRTWEAYREVFLRTNPVCYACGNKSWVVDHLRPHKGCEKLFKQLDNHIPLCNKCHNTVTALFDKNYIKGNTIEPKLKWLERMRIDYQCSVRVKVLPKYGP